MRGQVRRILVVMIMNRGVVHLLVPAAHPEKIRKALFTDSEVSNTIIVAVIWIFQVNCTCVLVVVMQ